MPARRGPRAMARRTLLLIWTFCLVAAAMSVMGGVSVVTLRDRLEDRLDDDLSAAEDYLPFLKEMAASRRVRLARWVSARHAVCVHVRRRRRRHRRGDIRSAPWRARGRFLICRATIWLICGSVPAISSRWAPPVTVRVIVWCPSTSVTPASLSRRPRSSRSTPRSGDRSRWWAAPRSSASACSAWPCGISSAEGCGRSTP